MLCGAGTPDGPVWLLPSRCSRGYARRTAHGADGVRVEGVEIEMGVHVRQPPHLLLHLRSACAQHLPRISSSPQAALDCHDQPARTTFSRNNQTRMKQPAF